MDRTREKPSLPFARARVSRVNPLDERALLLGRRFEAVGLYIAAGAALILDVRREVSLLRFEEAARPAIDASVAAARIEEDWVAGVVDVQRGVAADAMIASDDDHRVEARGIPEVEGVVERVPVQVRDGRAARGDVCARCRQYREQRIGGQPTPEVCVVPAGSEVEQPGVAVAVAAAIAELADGLGGL